jgi:hypothetical protein
MFLLLEATWYQLQKTDQPVEKCSVELTKERMSFPAQKNLEEGEASESNKKE